MNAIQKTGTDLRPGPDVDRRVVVLEATGDGDANGATEVAKNALIDQQFCASGPK